MDVIGFGAINLDEMYAVRSLAALPGPAMTAGSERTVDASEYERLTRLLEEAGARKVVSGGGQAANTVYALARLGFQTAIIGSVGGDEEGDFLLAGLAPVDTSQVVRGGRTPRCAVIVDRSGERTICVLSSPEEALLPDPIAAWGRLAGARFVHLTSLTHKEELKAQIKLVESVPNDVRVSFDPGELYCWLGVEALAPILRRTHVLFLGEREVTLLTGKSLSPACKKLLSLGPAVLVCKKGAKGIDVLTADGQRISVAARKVAVVDPTGAGDVFAAGFLAGLLLGLEPERCAVLGAEAAAESITGYGRSRYPGPELLESLGLRPPRRPRTAGGSPP